MLLWLLWFICLELAVASLKGLFQTAGLTWASFYSFYLLPASRKWLGLSTQAWAHGVIVTSSSLWGWALDARRDRGSMSSSWHLTGLNYPIIHQKLEFISSMLHKYPELLWWGRALGTKMRKSYLCTSGTQMRKKDPKLSANGRS